MREVIAAAAACVAIVLSGCGAAVADVPVGPGPTNYSEQPQPAPATCHYRTAADGQTLPDPACTPGAINPKSRKTIWIPRSVRRATASRFARRGRSPMPRSAPARPPTATPVRLQMCNSTTSSGSRTAATQMTHVTCGPNPERRQIPRTPRKVACMSLSVRAKFR